VAARTVGDPIDAITGAFFDSVQDFCIASDVPILWWRAYSSERVAEDRGLGRGHSHYFDHRLKFDLDGIRYTSPQGVTVDFPAFDAGVTRVARAGYVLSREDHRFRLRRPTDAVLIFELGASVQARLVEVREVGGSIFASHDLNGRLAALGDLNGNVVSFTWEAAHIVSARVLARGATQHVQLVKYRYDGDLLVEMEDAYKGHVYLAYDDAGRLVRRTDRSGYSFHFTYDADGRCVHSAGDDGVLEVRLEYFPFELRTRVTKSDGGVWEYFYDASKKLTKIVEPEGVARSFVSRTEDG
jgi:YD repeat-containing protein